MVAKNDLALKVWLIILCPTLRMSSCFPEFTTWAQTALLPCFDDAIYKEAISKFELEGVILHT